MGTLERPQNVASVGQVILKSFSGQTHDGPGKLHHIEIAKPQRPTP